MTTMTLTYPSKVKKIEGFKLGHLEIKEGTIYSFDKEIGFIEYLESNPRIVIYYDPVLTIANMRHIHRVAKETRIMEIDYESNKDQPESYDWREY